MNRRIAPSRTAKTISGARFHRAGHVGNVPHDDRTRDAASSGGQYQLPAVSQLLSLPEFAALKEFLGHWQVDAAQLQTKIDELGLFRV